MNTQPTPTGLDLDLRNAWNEDVVRPGFGSSAEVLLVRWRDRQERGRVRARPGYRLHYRDAGAGRLTAPEVAAHWYGDATGR